MEINKIKLVQKAIDAQSKAICPYSNYPVGAALLIKNKDIIIGFNIESKAYPTTLCAERVAIFSALSQGYDNFIAMAVATVDGGTPCGSCRQIIVEFAGDIPILVADSKQNYFETNSLELLPKPFA
tara:strand:- start:1671 stop:2048 length:378 start_codon:yes stop_codon:yes gene_type:complete